MKTMAEYIEEDRLQKEFIANMVDKYDYRAYEKYCLENNMRTLQFSMYALFVDPVVAPNPPVFQNPNAPVVPQTPKPCGGCGGGKVL